MLVLKKKRKMMNILKYFALSHLTPIQKAHLFYMVRKDIERIEMIRRAQSRRWANIKRERIRKLRNEIVSLWHLRLFHPPPNENGRREILPDLGMRCGCSEAENK
jgi:hypothetical protein